MDENSAGKDTKFRLPRVSDADVARYKQPARVLTLSVEGQLGGAERSLFELLEAMPRDKVEAQVCAPPDSPLLRLCGLAQVPVHPVTLRRFRRTLHPLVLYGQVRALYQGSSIIHKLCVKKRIEILHANTDSAALLAWEVARTTKIPFVWHCRDMRPLHGYGRALSAGAAAVVAISRAVEQHLLKERVAPDKIKRIDNGIDISRIHPPEAKAAVRQRIRATLQIPDNRIVVLCVGAYVPWKKHELFLEMLAGLRHRVPSILGVLAGSDHFKQNADYVELLNQRAHDLSLDHDILQVLNERDDIPNLMAAADILISCSDNEPFGRVLAEAGASGLPVIATRSGAKAEIIEDGVTGILTEPGNKDALMAGCAKLLTDAALREQMGRRARSRVEQFFDVKRTAHELAGLFESIVARQRG